LMYRNTTNISFLWDGNTVNSKPASEGVYFYYMQYEERGLSGNALKDARGSFTLMR
jgi:hypothetical protein